MFTYKPSQFPYSGFHKNWKTEFHDFSMTDLLLSRTPILTWFQIWLWLCLTTCMANHKLESCHSHENKQFHDFSMTFWEIFIFQDFSMTFHNSNFCQDFPWPWEACLLRLWRHLQHCRSNRIERTTAHFFCLRTNYPMIWKSCCWLSDFYFFNFYYLLWLVLVKFSEHSLEGG